MDGSARVPGGRRVLFAAALRWLGRFDGGVVAAVRLVLAGRGVPVVVALRIAGLFLAPAGGVAVAVAVRHDKAVKQVRIVALVGADVRLIRAGGLGLLAVAARQHGAPGTGLAGARRGRWPWLLVLAVRAEDSAALGTPAPCQRYRATPRRIRRA